MLSNRVFSRALSYDMRRSVRRRQWKSTIRRWIVRWSLWRTAKFFTTRVHVTHPYSSVSITPAFSMRTQQRERSGLHIVQFQFEPIEACPRESGPSFDIWHNVGSFVDKAAQVQKLNCLSLPLTCCFHDELQGKGCLVLWPQQHGFRLLLRHRGTRCFEDVHNDCHHLRKAFR